MCARLTICRSQCYPSGRRAASRAARVALSSAPDEEDGAADGEERDDETGAAEHAGGFAPAGSRGKAERDTRNRPADDTNDIEEQEATIRHVAHSRECRHECARECNETCKRDRERGMLLEEAA